MTVLLNGTNGNRNSRAESPSYHIVIPRKTQDAIWSFMCREASTHPPRVLAGTLLGTKGLGEGGRQGNVGFSCFLWKMTCVCCISYSMDTAEAKQRQVVRTHRSRASFSFMDFGTVNHRIFKAINAQNDLRTKPASEASVRNCQC